MSDDLNHNGQTTALVLRGSLLLACENHLIAIQGGGHNAGIQSAQLRRSGRGILRHGKGPIQRHLIGLFPIDRCTGRQRCDGIVHKGDCRAGIVLVLIQQADRTVLQLGQAGVHIVCAVVVDHIGVRQAQGLVVVEEEGVNATVLPSSAGGCRYQNSGLAVDWLGVAQD